MSQIIDENQIPVDIIVAKYFIQYKRLSRLIGYAFSGSKANTVNLYIDLYGLYRTLFSRTYRTDVSDYTAFTSSLINMCVHYRAFFKGIGVYCNIWLISSYNVPEINKKFVANYNKVFTDKLGNKMVKDMIELNSDLLEILCPYLPNIYYIKTEFESSVIIKHIIELELKKGNNNPNIILSTDIYPVQLCAEYNDTVFLRPIKSFGTDESVITTPKGTPDAKITFWSIICRQRDKLVSNENAIAISPSNFALLESLNRFPERYLENILDIRSSSKIIYSAVGESDIKTNPDMLFTMVPDLYNRVPKAKIDSRYNVLDIDYQYYLFTEMSSESMTLHYENLSDPDALEMINSQYFSKNPIDLLRL